MSDAHSADEKVPMMQQLLDNPFLLLFLGVMVPMLVYTLWGVIHPKNDCGGSTRWTVSKARGSSSR